jgi:hypothetical protein
MRGGILQPSSPGLQANPVSSSFMSRPLYELTSARLHRNLADAKLGTSFFEARLRHDHQHIVDRWRLGRT